ncbi:hypothetical protein FA13DRAFT_1717854 [Coprinellus micaceus]|uniref:F-box domain-containing protein n=1 Tax=Coprinellus micaceus TaxID=71717 RepID=A0A4Y7SEZ3_COPMI|nr:hypothetical protein FA13DRAFT_1717854 [Coprinellus micaceus]
MTPASTPRHLLPYDVVCYIANILSDSSESDYRVLNKQFSNYASVNRLFALVFQPRVFETTVIRSFAQVPKMIDILCSNPDLANHIKHLTLVMNGEHAEDNALLTALLDLFTAVGHLVVTSGDRSEVDGIRPSWGSFTKAFRRSIMRLCGLPTLRVLKIGEIDSVPASLFIGKAHLVDIKFSRCDPVFDSDSFLVADSGPGGAMPISFSVADIEFKGSETQEIIRHHTDFFSRLQRLEITTSLWRMAKYMSFCAIVSSLALVSQIDRLEVTVDQEMDNDPTRNRFLPIGALTNLRDLRLAHVFKKGGSFLSFWKLSDFFESVANLLESFHSSRLERLVVSFVELDDDSLDEICRTRGNNWKDLEKIIVKKTSEGALSRLNAVVACMEIDRTEHDSNLAFARKCMREAALLSEIGAGRRRVVMKSKLGTLQLATSPERLSGVPREERNYTGQGPQNGIGPALPVVLDSALTSVSAYWCRPLCSLGGITGRLVLHQ